MNWVSIDVARQEAGKYIIQRVTHYYYELRHQQEGAIRKYRTQEGARRAAERHKTGKSNPKKKASKAKLDATMKFQTPTNDGE